MVTTKKKRVKKDEIPDGFDPIFDMSTPEDIFLQRGFRGSKKLKRVGELVEWTDERMREYKKCEKDPLYFCKKYVKIVSLDEGIIPFRPHKFQIDMLESMWKRRNTVITTARQIGKSTVTCAFIVWYATFHPNKSVALLANKGDTAREIMGKVHLAYENLPKWLQQGVVNANKGSLELENGSRILATATSGSAIRGYTVNLLFIDEAAFVEDWDTFFTAVMPTISSGKTTKIILVSTPNGLNHYYKIWKYAGGINPKERRNNYYPIQVCWWEVPGRDQQWKDDTLAQLNFDEEKFAQENECQFLGSSGTLISGKALKELVVEEPINASEGLKQYVAPLKDRNYVIIVDTSAGKGLDYSAFSVIDVTEMPYKQVCTFNSNQVPPAEYAEIIHNIAKAYFNPMILVEINNMGQTVADTLWFEFEYENLLFTNNMGRSGKQITVGGSTKKTDMGVNTSMPVKRMGCSMLKLLIEQKQLIVTDMDTIHELSVFSKKGQSYEAESGEHDDLVMTLVLFGWLTDQKFFKELTDINTVREIRDRREEDLENEMIPFGFIVQSAEHFDDKVDPLRSIDQPAGGLFNDNIGHDKAAIDQMLNDSYLKFLLGDTNIRN